ncbi:hypothetical protein [Zhihengliuella halotolerans]|uniref:Uncharacterized protein n=1 Tax=Zhihengliuella halotolerans TaxID=370736 RepID=A0A4Q8AC89_9MICC|nr:hypothetical protein [Zhihengliuella halotolerans]RZU61758.1 hypothetical protein EV380_1336 [Zhihengliuella halotolerans]
MSTRVTQRDHYLQEANEAAGQAIARALGHDWNRLSVSTQAELALAGRAAVDAASPWLELTVLKKWLGKVGAAPAVRDWMEREINLLMRHLRAAAGPRG